MPVPPCKAGVDPEPREGYVNSESRSESEPGAGLEPSATQEKAPKRQQLRCGAGPVGNEGATTVRNGGPVLRGRWSALWTTPADCVHHQLPRRFFLRDESLQTRSGYG